MTTSLSSLLTEQFEAITAFQRASGSRYPGPSHSMESLLGAISKADDVDTDSLREAADYAVGHKHSGVWKVGPVQWLEQKAIEKTTEFAKHAVADALRGFGVQFDEETQQRDEFLHQAKSCADAIDSCLDVSTDSLREFINMPIPLLGMLAVLLKGLRTRTSEGVLHKLVSVGQDLIEGSHAKILQQCQDRDAQLKRYYELLEQKGQVACQSPHGEARKNCPLPAEEDCAPPADQCPPADQRPAPEDSGEGEKGGGAGFYEPKTDPAGVEPCPPADSGQGGNDHVAGSGAGAQHYTGGGSQEGTSSNSGTEGAVDCAEEGVVTPEQPVGQGTDIGGLLGASGANCSGILGQVGAGIAVAGVGVLIAGVVNFVKDHPLDVGGLLGLNLDVSITPDVPDVPDVPDTLDVPDVPVDESDCAVDGNGVFQPPEELQHVPEPTPPAEKLAHLGHAPNATGGAAPNSGMLSHPDGGGQPPLASAQVGASSSVPGTVNPPAAGPEGSLHIKKAGQW